MSDEEVLELHFDIEGEPSEADEPKKTYGAAIGCTALVFMLALMILPYSQTTSDSNGTRTDSWESVMHYAYGAAATSRKEVFPNGCIRSGPLKDGKMHGSWRYDLEAGALQQRNFINGRPIQ